MPYANVFCFSAARTIFCAREGRWPRASGRWRGSRQNKKAMAWKRLVGEYHVMGDRCESRRPGTGKDYRDRERGGRVWGRRLRRCRHLLRSGRDPASAGSCGRSWLGRSSVTGQARRVVGDGQRENEKEGWGARSRNKRVRGHVRPPTLACAQTPSLSTFNEHAWIPSSPKRSQLRGEKAAKASAP